MKMQKTNPLLFVGLLLTIFFSLIVIDIYAQTRDFSIQILGMQFLFF